MLGQVAAVETMQGQRLRLGVGIRSRPAGSTTRTSSIASWPTPVSVQQAAQQTDAKAERDHRQHQRQQPGHRHDRGEAGGDDNSE